MIRWEMVADKTSEDCSGWQRLLFDNARIMSNLRYLDLSLWFILISIGFQLTFCCKELRDHQKHSGWFISSAPTRLEFETPTKMKTRDNLMKRKKLL